MTANYFKIFGITLLFSFYFTQTKAQQGLPNNLTADELLLLPTYQFPTGDSRSITTPPTMPIRSAAEWEEVQTLLITWTTYPDILAQIVDAAQEECEVLITCSDSNAVKSYLTNLNIPLTNVSYLVAGFNSIWLRDYSAHTAYLNDVDSLVMVEWIYNRPRALDDAMPVAQMDYKGITLYSTTQAPNDLVNTGGNWMVDGFGTAFASKLIFEDNLAGNPYTGTAKTEAQIDTIVKKFQGIERYIKMQTLPYDVIHHIDMHMKLIDEETLLVGEYPAGISDGPQIEANLQYVLSTYNSVYGTPYKVVRIPMPPSTSGNNPGGPFGNGSYRTYANNVFINKTVLVPYYRQQYDTTAFRILSDAMPGYNIIGIDCDDNNSNIIAQSGAIHCITNTIGVNDPLLIRHQALENTNDSTNPYQVDALIMHKSGIANASVFYSTDFGNTYQSVTMTLTNATDNTWTGFIPAQVGGSMVYYYIDANANSGKHQVRPIVAPNGYWKFEVGMATALKTVSTSTFEIKDIYPNPGKGITCIPVHASASMQLNVAVYDVTGRIVSELFNGEVQAGDKNVFLNCATLQAGIYQVVYTTDTNRYVKKLCVSK